MVTVLRGRAFAWALRAGRRLLGGGARQRRQAVVAVAPAEVAGVDLVEVEDEQVVHLEWGAIWVSTFVGAKKVAIFKALSPAARSPRWLEQASTS